MCLPPFIMNFTCFDCMVCLVFFIKNNFAKGTAVNFSIIGKLSIKQYIFNFMCAGK